MNNSHETDFDNISHENFRKAVAILNSNKIFFWIDQGTLLGFIRDNMLIPWDHDMDFAVWYEKTDRNLLIENFEKSGFRVEEIPNDMDCIHFLGQGGRKVDITFYQNNVDVATTRWIAPKTGLYRRIIKKILDFLELNSLEEFSGIQRRKRFQVIKTIVLKIMARLIYIMPKVIKKYSIKLLQPLNEKYPTFELVQFSVPMKFFSKFKEVEFLNTKVNIPAEAEKYLAFTYGNDWRIPKQKWNWWQESGGLKSIT